MRLRSKLTAQFLRALLIPALQLASSTRAVAQESRVDAVSAPSNLTARVVPDDTTKTFFVRPDLSMAAIALGGTAMVSSFDKRIARYSQGTTFQGSSSRRSIVKKLTHINETTLTAAAILGYASGRLARSGTIADVALHTGEALVLTSAVSQLIRGPLGRARPSVSPDDPFHFQFGKGFTHFDNRAFPSLHSATAFAAAAALSSEVHERNPNVSWIVSPLLFGAACIPGLTRIYLHQHWASDVVAGAFVGTMLGTRVVHYAHTHQRTRIDRALLGVSIFPDRHGGLDVPYSFER